MRRITDNPSKLEAFRGCLLGGAVGDALGASVEFLTEQEIRTSFGPNGICDLAPAYGKVGAITDDTQMTLFTAEGLIRGWVRFCERGLGPSFATTTMYAYLRWLETQGYPNPSPWRSQYPGWLISEQALFERRAPGNTCLSALRDPKILERHEPSERAPNNSKGCGGIMRISPVGLFRTNWSPPDRIYDTIALGMDIAGITHGHPTGYFSAGYFARLIELLVRGEPFNDALERAKSELREHAGHEETIDAVERAQALARSGKRHKLAIRELGEGWLAEEALAIAVYCVLVAEDFESGVLLAVNHDGDSDSTGSLAGNLLGTVYGLHSIPKSWIERLELADLIKQIADDLASAQEWDLDPYSGDSPEYRFYSKRYPPN